MDRPVSSARRFMAVFFTCAGFNAADAQGQSPSQVAPPARDVPAPAAHSRSAVTTEWKEAINDDGIVVYKRKRAGSAYEEVRAITVMPARVDDFIPFFNEPSNYRKWVYGTMESRQVSRAAAMDFVFYGVFKIPWPFENRELFSRVEMLRDEKNNELQARLTDFTSDVPVGADLVRVAQFESLWKVRGVPNGKVDFSIEMYAEPGGNLPPFIVNLVLSRIQLWSMKNLRNRILNRKN